MIFPIGTANTASNAQGTTEDDLTVFPPTGSAVGDLLIAISYKPNNSGATYVITPTSQGWTAATSFAQTTNIYGGVWWKVAESADFSNGVNVTLSSASGFGLGICALRGAYADTTNAIHVSSFNSSGGSDATVTSTSISVTTRCTPFVMRVWRKSNTTESTCDWTAQSGTELMDFGIDSGSTTRQGSAFLGSPSISSGSYTADSTLTSSSSLTESIVYALALREVMDEPIVPKKQAIITASRW